LVVNVDCKLDTKMRTLLEHEFSKYFETDISYVVNDNVVIKSGGEKLKSFISKV